MLLSLNWLKDYLAKSDLKIDPKDLADKLTMRGLHVAAIKRPAFSLENVVVGKIEKIDKHPNADRLQVTQVVTKAGENVEPIQIVCGAKNIAVGDIVPIALPGSILPGDFEIKQSTIRGVESFGMICSGKELGISEDSEGILQLPKHSGIGQPLTSLLGGGTNDTILEFELTPNRSDCLSVLGLAREIAPVLKTKLREQKPAKFKITPHRTSSIIKVEVEDPNVCPRYVARVIDGLKVTESPDWIKQRLEAVGIRPINNIVDITNFVMIEYGQPLHAFDLRKIQSGTIKVATCKTPTDFTVLSGESVGLEPGDILIQDGDRPIALAGIMGGGNSQIASDTTSIVLESAAFLPAQIRKTVKRLALHTESSKRFEKGFDLAVVALASERAASLLRDSMNANVYHPPIDTNEYGAKEAVISIDMRDVRKITGLKEISAETAANLLDSIDIPSHKKSVNILSVRLPTHRQDLKGNVDLIEEVARLAGYDTIPEHLPTSLATYDRLDESTFDFEFKAKSLCCSMGLRETIHYSFVSEELLRSFGFSHEQMVSLKNPLSDEMKVLRTSLLPSLLQTYSYNLNRKVAHQRLFEVAKTFAWDAKEETQVKEVPHLAGLLSGNLSGSGWKDKTLPLDFYHVKGLVENLVRQLTSVKLSFEAPKNTTLYHPSRSASIKLGLKEVGSLGEIHPVIRDNVLETNEPVMLFEINLEALKKYERLTTRYKTPSKFPAIELDLAFVVDKTVSCHAVLENMKHTGGDLLSDVSVFDVYEGDSIGASKKSMAFHLTFQSVDRTLQDNEIQELKTRLLSNLKDKFGADLRG
jgi:phenylalanyl-tRNA synthetase beta chain